MYQILYIKGDKPYSKPIPSKNEACKELLRAEIIVNNWNGFYIKELSL